MPKRKRKGPLPTSASVDLEPTVKVVQWAAEGGRHQALSLALKPLVLLRAAKYQLDAQGKKLQPQARSHL